jgi:hypothetical protein
MEAGNTHKMGIRRMDEDEPEAAEIPGPAGGGEIPGIYLRCKGIEPAHGINKIAKKPFPSGPVPVEDKAGYSDPKEGEIQIDSYPFGEKGDFGIQGMIYPGDGDGTQQGRLVLEKEKIIDDSLKTPEAYSAESGVEDHL